MMTDIPLSTLLLASLAFVFSLYTILFIRSAYFTPLRHIPGPWYAKFTNIWLKTQNLRGRRMFYIHDLHLRYGPVIRIAPQEVDIADLDGYREIHRIGSGFHKTRWYEVMRNTPVPDIFAILDSKKHSDRRKLYARPFSNTSLRDNWEYVVKAKVELAVSRLKREAELGSADIYKWWTLMTTDVICTLSFGEDFQMLEKGEISREIIDMEKGAALGGARAEFETLYAILKWLKIPGLQKIMDAPERILEYSKVAVSNARAGNLGSSNIFSAVLAENEKGTGALTDLDLAVEASGLIVAGSGTTAVTLTYLVWAVISNPDVQRQLQDEVAMLPTSFSDKELEALPYLNAVVDESLRLYGAAPSSLPRVVPQRGAIFKGYHVPAGTIVNTQAYTIHREGEIFREPYKFEPARFLDGITKEQRAALNPFGAGARTCLGMHLARMELRHATAEFFRECAGAVLAPSTTPKSMEMVNYFLITPAGEKCDVILR